MHDYLHVLLVDVVPEVGKFPETVGTLAGWGPAAGGGEGQRRGGASGEGHNFMGKGQGLQ